MLKRKKCMTKLVVFILVVSTVLCSMLIPASAFTSSDADTAFNSFNSKFYSVTNGNGYFKRDTTGGQADFWREAEMHEIVIDAYNRTGNATQKNMIIELYNGFISKWGNDWMSNKYNDDIMWMSIACLRGYQATGNTTLRAKAKDQFDKTYARAWSSDLGGGLWWTTDKNEKNACVNGPGAIAAYLLYVTLNDSTYLTKATNIYNWEKTNLFVSSTGGVNDNKNKNGTVSTYKSTYNQGTFIGIANYLYKQTGNVTYLNDAKKAADYTKNSMCNSNGILPDEYSTGGDLDGFKSIFARWMSKFMIENSLQSTYLSWMQKNADSAWANRNSAGLMWTRFATKTPETTLSSWTCASALSFLQNCPSTTVVPKATFYQNSNYGGTAVSLVKGNYTMAQLSSAGLPNDWTSSLKVPSGLTVEIYQHDNFTGTKWTFTADTTYVGSACNDQMTSVKIY